MDHNYYCINRDIVCRVEEPEGAIIFSPATGSVKTMDQDKGFYGGYDGRLWKILVANAS